MQNSQPPNGSRNQAQTAALRFTPEEVANSLTAAGGNVSKAAHYLNCHRTTVYNYITRHEEVRAAGDEERERRKDVVEENLFQLAEGGDITACIFWAKTQMRNRGFIERDKMDYREVLMALGHDPGKVLATYADDLNQNE